MDVHDGWRCGIDHDHCCTGITIYSCEKATAEVAKLLPMIRKVMLLLKVQDLFSDHVIYWPLLELLVFMKWFLR